MVVPFHGDGTEMDKMGSPGISDDFSDAAVCWETKSTTSNSTLPSSADRIINTYKSNLVYILIKPR